MESKRNGEFENKVRDAYNYGAERYCERWSRPHYWMAEEREEFSKYATEGKSLVDIGCGPGNDSDYWSSRGLVTTGIDFSAGMIGRARFHFPKLEFLLMDATRLGCLGRGFDLAWSAYCLLHIPPQSVDLFLDGIAQVLNGESPLLFLSTLIGEKTGEDKLPIAGLLDAKGQEIKAPVVVWALADLREVLGQFFVERWSKTSRPLADRGFAYSGIFEKRR